MQSSRWAKVGEWPTLGKGSRDGGEGFNLRQKMGQRCVWRPCTKPRSSFSHSGIVCTFMAPDTPSSWQDGSRGALPRLPACLLAPGSSSLAKWGRETEQKRLPRHSTPRSLLFIPGSLSIWVLSLFLSCTACCFPGLVLPPLSAECQSSHRRSSSHPQHLCPRTREPTADTHTCSKV